MKSPTPSSLRRFPWAFGLLVAPLAMAWGCKEDPKPPVAEKPPAPAPTAAAPTPGTPAPAPTAEPAQLAPGAPVGDNLPEPHPGPWLWVTRSSAGVYLVPRPDKDKKLGYVQIGGKVPVLAEKVEGENCSKGWYKVASGGYICSMVGTTDEKDPIAKFPPRQPNVEALLPYPYMRNAHNGTPLYRSLPSREQMYEYEPYLPAAKKAKEAKTEGEAAPAGSAALPAEPAAPSPLPQPSLPPPEGDSGAPVAAAPPEPLKWWESGENLHEVKLEHLSEDADGILVKRMVKGFYVAVDKSFPWNGRSWYKTTKGVIAPADRFWQAAASDFQGVEIDGEKWKLPLAWVYGLNKTSTLYEIDPEAKKITSKGTVPHFGPVQLTGKTLTYASKDYLETADGSWIKASTVRRTTPEPRPEGVGENERWLDIDISEQTLVVYQGDTPLYATLISSGKESRIKEKDHATPRGMWRVREKHVVATMDGDGSAAGDLPYSIEDVPYVMYFHKAYATHTAFWHQNFGYQMSHGCVNLAPLDAKWLFFHLEPPLPEGLHGVWSSEEKPGSMVVIHD
ncbi:MAG TPA: L,D-transpeptidase [Polyangiaceae bacterium]|nr:L,D-transpeptidase [Polyangiaceae bacterium]